MWRAVVHQKRCIVIASGFFEWKEHKRPHYIHPKDDEVMALAGLYDVHKNAESAPLDGCRSDPFRLAGEEEWTYSVVTVQASQVRLHTDTTHHNRAPHTTHSKNRQHTSRNTAHTALPTGDRAHSRSNASDP